MTLPLVRSPWGAEVERAARPAAPAALPVELRRLEARGKFLFDGDAKFFVRGVTYGPFRPEADGCEYHDRARVDADFLRMAASGLNAVRLYTVPPRWLLDSAQRHGLRAWIGLPWEQHVMFLDGRRRARDIEERVARGAAECTGHPAVMGYAIGNEVPAPIVRWYGHRRVEGFLHRLYDAAKASDPQSLVTYVNYPSTEYLHLPFVDVVAFNVYLQQRERLERYLARLQNLANDRPLLLAEVGLDSRRNGRRMQAETLSWQIESLFAAGCAGGFVFAWTDEWHRGGHEITDWDFGLTRRDRRPKPALGAVRKAFTRAPFRAGFAWPKVSVVVCTYNGGRTIRRCLEALARLAYPEFEVIVVDDGSTDDAAAVAAGFREHNVRLISTTNHGLSHARNVGLEAAGGDIVAYIDDDAWPDRDWLAYLVHALMTSGHAGVGGPNLPPPEDGITATAVAHAPGGPTHVLLTDVQAEHIPGCNMAFRRDALLAVGGFDAQFRIAGDDVDLCWRLQDQGRTLGFSPGAVVWHHRRRSVRGYWLQQLNYGKAEAMLERKWPERYNGAGHLTWSGRLYGPGLYQLFQWSRRRIYHGTWGVALFQSVYQVAPGRLWSVLAMPEWYLALLLLATASVAGLFWPPLAAAAPLLALGVTATAAHALFAAARMPLSNAPARRGARLRLRGLIALLQLMQPAARLWGRLRSGLTPWRTRGVKGLAVPWPRLRQQWSESWQSPEQRLQRLETALRQRGAVTYRGGEFDRWDLGLRGGALGRTRMRLAIEEHGGGKQLIRIRLWPACSRQGVRLAAVSCLAAAIPALSQAWLVSAIIFSPVLVVAMVTLHGCAASMATMLRALEPERSGAAGDGGAGA